MRASLVLLLFALLQVVVPTSAPAAPSADIPLESWVYPALDRLSAAGLIESSLQGNRPWSRREAARQTAEATGRAGESQPPSAALRLLEQLINEFAGELTAEPSPLHLRRTEVSGIYQEGSPSPYPGTAAYQFPLVYNRYGLTYSKGQNVEVSLQAEASFGKIFLAEWRPLGQWREGTGSSTRTLTGVARLGLGPAELSAGRQPLWWGKGRHGSLLLTNNARPLDLFRLTNPHPATPPLIFAPLGPTRFDLFVTRLEADREVSRPWLTGMRFDFRPLPWLEAGLGRTIMFGGREAPGVNLGDFLEILGGENPSDGEEDRSNSIAGLDLSLTLPLAGGVRLYGELAGEDEAGHFCSGHAWLAGVFLPFLGPDQRGSLRLEYADLTWEKHGTNPWYRHGLYRSGYTYRGKILGHHAGGGARDYSASYSHDMPGNVNLGIGLDYERRGESLPVQEKHLQTELTLRAPLGAWLTLEAAWCLDRIENFAYIPGEDRTFHLARIALSATW